MAAEIETRLGFVEKEFAVFRGEFVALKDGVGRIEQSQHEVFEAIKAIGKGKQTELEKALDDHKSRRPNWWNIAAACGSSVAVVAFLGNLMVSVIVAINAPIQKDITALAQSDTRFGAELAQQAKSIALLDQQIAGLLVRIAEQESWRKWYFIDRNIPGENARRDAQIDELKREVEYLRKLKP